MKFYRNSLMFTHYLRESYYSDIIRVKKKEYSENNQLGYPIDYF